MLVVILSVPVREKELRIYCGYAENGAQNADWIRRQIRGWYSISGDEGFAGQRGVTL